MLFKKKSIRQVAARKSQPQRNCEMTEIIEIKNRHHVIVYCPIEIEMC